VAAAAGLPGNAELTVSGATTLERISEVLLAMGIRAQIGPETRIGDDLALDSLRRIELAIEVENRFRIILEPEDETRIQTIGDLAEVIDRRLAWPVDGACDAPHDAAGRRDG